MIKYNKLIRDKIVEKIESTKGTAVYHRATDQEFEIKLKEKLIEEANELTGANDIESIKNELADVLKVTKEIMKLHAISEEEIKEIMQEKDEKAGGFDKRIILEEASEY